MITINRWSDFQHYKDRTPPWIKLHRSLLDNMEYRSLSDSAARFLTDLWLFAAEEDKSEGGGAITKKLEEIAWRLRDASKTLADYEQMAQELDSKGFISVDSKMLADRLQGATTESEGETKTEAKTEVEIMPSKLDASSDILAFLNSRTGKGFKPVDSNLKLIKARMKEGHSEQEILSVIERKCIEWPPGHKMNQYLRPSTLFGAEKFNQYVGELSVPSADDLHQQAMDEFLGVGQEKVVQGDLV